MTFEIAFTAAGGLGIFLLAMSMMTEGLKVFGGENLRTLLEKGTSRPVAAAASGALVTAVVQSSSAVTVATIGFVNAGLLTLSQSLGVIIGSNVGTTMTGWLVSLVGFGFKIEALAMPLIAAGMAARVAAQSKRLRGLGEAVAGFGLFFLGLAILKEAFSGVAEVFGTATLAGDSAGAVVMFVFFGMVATVLTQSSSAAIALILTAASESALGLGPAAAAIIGANVGTTSTAIFAALNATPNARRVAAGHIGFNVVTGVVAVLTLPVLLWLIDLAGNALGFGGQPAATLALFHTTFNLLGAVLLLPFVGVASVYLGRLFKTEEEDLTRPLYLDNTIIQAPDIAMAALKQELLRMAALVRENALAALQRTARRPHTSAQRAEALAHLGLAVQEFSVKVRMEGMSRGSAEKLPAQIRIARYLEESSRLLEHLDMLAAESRRTKNGPAAAALTRLVEAAEACFRVEPPPQTADPDCAARLDEAKATFETVYQETKAALLHTAAQHSLRIDAVDGLLDVISRSRRMVDQYVKAMRLLMSKDEESETEDRVSEYAA